MQIGDRIPHFRAPASTGQTLSWDAYEDKIPVVLFFLTGTDDEADADELREIDRLLAGFGSRRVQALGVVKATATEVRGLADRLDLDVPVLADPAGALAEEAGAAMPDGSFRRITLVFDRTGRLAKSFEPAAPSGHAETVLQAIDELSTEDDWEFEPAVPG